MLSPKFLILINEANQINDVNPVEWKGTNTKYSTIDTNE